MISMHSRKPSNHFIKAVTGITMAESDWLYFAECTEAEKKCQLLMEYLAEVAKNNASISEDIVTYIMAGKDFYSFAKELKETQKH